MGWLPIEKQGAGRGGSMYGSGWGEYPCVGITKSGISTNSKFCEAFCSDGSMQVLVFVDLTRRVVGLKVIPRGEEIGIAYTLSRTKKRSGKSANVTVHAVPKAFPDAVGHAYRAHMNPNGKIIEVELSQSNRG